MSDLVKVSIIAAVAVLIAVAASIYFSPYQSCMRAMEEEKVYTDANDAVRCARK